LQVSEKIASLMVPHFGASGSRFTASGREDVDVRMLGQGRPFVVQLLNPRRTAALLDQKSAEQTLVSDLMIINVYFYYYYMYLLLYYYSISLTTFFNYFSSFFSPCWLPRSMPAAVGTLPSARWPA
jgi:hypothetical protein